MNKEQTSIGPWLLGSMMAMLNLSYGYINSITYECKTLGAGGYLGIIFAALFSLPGLVAIFLLMKRFPEQNLIQQGSCILGDISGRIAGFLYLLFLLIFFAVYSRDVLGIIPIYFLEFTPLAIVAAVTFLVSAYLGSRGIETISRLASFVILPLWILLTLLGISMVTDISINRLMPIFDLHPTGSDGSILNFFYPLGLFALITPYIKGIRHKIPHVTLWVFISLIFTSLLYSIGTIGHFGHEYLMRFAYPVLETIRCIDLPFLMIEQAGLFLAINLFSSVIIGFGYIFYIIGLSSSQIFRVWDYKGFVWLTAPVIFFMMISIPTITQTKFLAAMIAKYAWIPIWGYPILLFILAVIFKKEGNKIHVS